MTEKNEPRITMAALVAMLEGDVENAIVASTPGGIEAQEARGQQDFVAGETLPIKMAWGTTKEQVEAMGIEYVDPIDDLFWYVRLPEGWKKEATDHSMHSNLLDEQGRKRARIFYKAAFYDRRADIGIVRRFSVQVRPVDGWENHNRATSWWSGVVLDGEVEIWESERLVPEPEYESSKHGDDQRKVWLAWQDQKDALADQCREWLNENYPDWEDPLAYWDC
jgi:hypothetical protein